MNKYQFYKAPTLPLLFFLGFSLIFSPLIAQNITQEKFGKNRLQYKKFNWRNLSTNNFDVYYYDSGSRLANFATRYLESEFNEITEVLGHVPYFKTKIFIYNSISDLQQSNVGIDDDEIITGGQTDFFKSQVEIPFTGSEVDFKIELRRGIALMLIREMMFGGSLKDMLQNSYLGKFSEWFLLGGAEYVAKGWTVEMDDYVRDLFRRRKIKKPNLLDREDAVLVGQSIWNFIAEEYGKSNITNILTLARIIRNERNSIATTLNISYKGFIKRWKGYYEGMTNETLSNTEPSLEYDLKLRKRNRKNRVYNEMKISPNGQKIAYSETLNGRYRVVVQDLQKGKRKVLMRNGYRAIGQRFDEHVPLLSWRDNNNLGIVFVRKGELKLEVRNMKKKVSYERDWFFFSNIEGFDFSDSGNQILISADRKGQIEFKTGQNDIFLFDIEKVTLDKITDDWYDDLDPTFFPGSNDRFIFSSNRDVDTLSTTLRTEQGNYNEDLTDFNIFKYDPRQSRTRVERLTFSPGVETQPRFLNENTILYLNDVNGIEQLYASDINQKESRALSNLTQSLRGFEVNPLEDGLAYLMIKKGRLYPYYKRNFDFSQEVNSQFQTFRVRELAKDNPEEAQNKPVPEDFEPVVKPVEEVYGEDEVNTDNYTFDEEIVDKKQSSLERVQDSMLERVRKANREQLQVKGPYDYEARFRTENVLTTARIDPLRGWGLLLNMNASDLLENHKIRLGGFLLADLRSSDFYAEYQFLGKRLDYKGRYDRKSMVFNNSLFAQNHRVNILTGTVSMPIRNTSRVSVSPIFTSISSVLSNNDGVNTFLFSDPNNRYNYLGYKVEYVYDNTVLNGQNMISGFRMKASYESHFGLSLSPELVDLGAEPAELNFNKINLDIRHYLKIHKDLILATRVSYGRFGGRSPKSFMLGGMDNWLFNSLDASGSDRNLPDNSITALSDTPIQIVQGQVDPAQTGVLGGATNGTTTAFFGNESLIFNEFITNLRGYNYNKISGQNYFLLNAELRFPIIKYLFGKRINSNFLKNFQVVGFYDIGSAWTGISPFNRENSLNTRTVEQGAFDIEVNDFKNPWLSGYGFGARTVLFGYYLKMDVAWAVEDFVVADRPKFYFTFGYDF